MDNRNLIAGLWQTTLGIAFVGLGILGIFRSLSPAPRALPRESQRAGLAPYADHRIGLLRARLRRAPNDLELRMSLARAYTARAMVTVHQEYSEAFPTAFQEGKFPVDHYETWRRGWCHRDRDGDLRRAVYHARRILAARPPTPLRLAALRLVAYVLRQRSQEAAAIPVLKEAVALAPRDALAWNLLADLYRLTGETARFQEAHRRLQALNAPQEALPVRIVPDLEYRRRGLPQAANPPRGRPVVPAAG